MSALSIRTNGLAPSKVQRWLLVAILTGFGAALGAFFVCEYAATRQMRSMMTASDGELLWLRREFNLTDAQYNRIKLLHEKYSAQCDLMCQRIAEVNARLDALISANREVTPALASTINEASRVQEDCRRAMLAHIYEVGAIMTPSSGARYVDMMKATIIQPGLPSKTVVSQ